MTKLIAKIYLGIVLGLGVAAMFAITVILMAMYANGGLLGLLGFVASVAFVLSVLWALNKVICS